MKGSGPKGDTASTDLVYGQRIYQCPPQYQFLNFDARGLIWGLIEKGIHQLITIST